MPFPAVLGALAKSAVSRIGGALIGRQVARIGRTLPGGAPVSYDFDASAMGTYTGQFNTPAGAPSVVPTNMMASLPALGGAIVRGGAMAGRALGRNRKRIATLARGIGIQAAATALGMSVVDVAESVVRSRPRRRGITAAQFSNAKRVNRKVLTMACQLSDLRAKTKRACK